jgi:hypothetical protein
MLSFVGRGFPSDEEQALLNTIDDPSWLGGLVGTIRWLCAPWELIWLASKLTPELISNMPTDNAAEWYNYLSNQYTMIMGLPPDGALLDRAWKAGMRYSASRFEKPIELLWERSQARVEQTAIECYPSGAGEPDRMVYAATARGA